MLLGVMAALLALDQTEKVRILQKQPFRVYSLTLIRSRKDNGYMGVQVPPPGPFSRNLDYDD